MTELESPGKPEMVVVGNSYRFTWPVGIEAEVDRLADHRDELTAEVTIRSSRPPRPGLLHSARLNLMSTRARSDLAKALAICDEDVDWTSLLEVMCFLARERHREGEPAVVLDDLPENIAPLYELPPLALRNMLTIAFGRPGEGKTWLLCGVGVTLATGRSDILGLAPTRQVRPLFLDWEDDEHRKKARVHAIAGGPSGMIYLACRGAIWDELDRIQRAIREHSCDYLLIDSVGMACGGIPPESSEAALRFMNAYRRLGLGGFAAAHLPHDAKEESRPFGSVFWNAQARLTWFVKREQDFATNGLRLGLFNRKSNNDKPSFPLAYDVTFDGGRVRFTKSDIANDAELGSHQPIKWQVRDALKSGPKSYVELASILGADLDSIRRAVNRDEGKLFVRAPEGADRVSRWANLARRTG
jgi:hypothetical protein